MRKPASKVEVSQAAMGALSLAMAESMKAKPRLYGALHMDVPKTEHS
jgi:hypothetical protein